MKKSLLMLLAGFMVLGASAKVFADARLDSMGADARQIGDIDLIWMYPNMVMDYKNTADFRLGSNNVGFGDGNNEWGGALVEIDPDFGVLGAYVNRPNGSTPISKNLFVDSWDSSTLNQEAGVSRVLWNWDTSYQNNLDLFWGKKFGDSDFGLHFNYASGNTDSGPDNDTDLQVSVYSLDAGLGLSNIGPFNSLNIHAGYLTQSFNDHAGDKDNGIYNAKLGALATSALNPDNDLRLFADLMFDGYKIPNFNDDLSDWNLNLGAAINRKIDGGKGLFSTGLILGYQSFTSPASSSNYKVASWDLLWNASLEAPVSDWLTVRTGLTKLIVSRVWDANNNWDNDGTYFDNSNDRSQNVQFSTGFGINWQNFTLNASVSAASLENSIQNIQPGKGILFAGNILTVETADLSYKF